MTSFSAVASFSFSRDLDPLTSQKYNSILPLQ